MGCDDHVVMIMTTILIMMTMMTIQWVRGGQQRKVGWAEADDVHMLMVVIGHWQKVTQVQRGLREMYG